MALLVDLADRVGIDIDAFGRQRIVTGLRAGSAVRQERKIVHILSHQRKEIIEDEIVILRLEVEIVRPNAEVKATVII
ncbi:hypothetical protein [Brevundimonas sp.]|uniref:hypothetical protein n=1 Tax=Brevundimonas sp. TaxID=1871086 RepID=UPI003AFFE209